MVYDITEPWDLDVIGDYLINNNVSYSVRAGVQNGFNVATYRADIVNEDASFLLLKYPSVLFNKVNIE